MKQAEFVQGRPKRGWLKVVVVVVAVLVVALAGLVLTVPKVRNVLKDPGAIFKGDDSLVKASRELASAERKLLVSPHDDAAHLARAKAYLQFGYLEGARIEFDSRPKDAVEGWTDVGQSLSDIESKTDEIRSLLNAAETSPSPAEKYPPIYSLLDDVAGRYTGIPKYRALFLKGYLLLREGRKAEAEPIFGKELKNYVPLKAYVTYNHAKSLAVEGSMDKALAEFDRFIGENPDNRLAPLAYLEKINILRDLQKNDQAISECRKAIDKYPKSPFAAKTLRKWAEIYESAADFDNSIPIRLRILKEFPGSDESSDTQNRFFGGEYSVSLLSEPDQLDVAYASTSSHPDDAFSILSALADSASLTSEQRSKACQGAGSCEYKKGRYFEAINWYTRATGLAPATEWADKAGIQSGQAYHNLDKEDLAIQSLWAVAKGRGPLASEAAETLYQSAYERSDIPTVDQAARFIIDEYPSSDQTPEAMAMMAYLGCRSGQYQTGRGFGEKCVKAFPEDPASAEAGYWLARSLDGLGQRSDARRSYAGLAERVPWSYWGIRASEIMQLPIDKIAAIDVLSFDSERSSVYKGNLATAWELYDAGVLDLAESEFRVAIEKGEKGGKCGLALVQAEEKDLHSAVLSLRDAALVGDQSGLTPAKQRRVLDQLYPRVFEQAVMNASLAQDVPVSWLWGAMRQESTYNPRAHSPAGASGLIQIMPETAKFIASKRGISYDPSSLWDPATNVDFGAWYFSYLRTTVGDNLLFIMASYNGGPGRVMRWREQLPTRDDDIFINAIPNEETRNFAHWVYSNVRMYDRILKADDIIPGQE